MKRKQTLVLVVNLCLGWKDSNLRMAGPKPAALPLGDTPIVKIFLKTIMTEFLFFCQENLLLFFCEKKSFLTKTQKVFWYAIFLFFYY